MFAWGKWLKTAVLLALLVLLVVGGQVVAEGGERPYQAELVADLNESQSERGSYPYGFVEKNGELYFGALGTNSRSTQLWKTDGTSEGTSLVKAFDPSQHVYGVVGIFSFDEKLVYLTANDAIHGLELWRSDGTEAGTLMLLDFNPNGDSQINIVAELGEKLIFEIKAKEVNNFLGEVWVTDGTVDGTVPLGVSKEMYPYEPAMVVEDKAFFVGYLEEGVQGLWVTDGTPENTTGLGTFSSYEGSGFNGGQFTSFNNKLYFLNEGNLWESDGTIEGTVEVNEENFTDFYALDDNLVLYHETSSSGQTQIYVSDGTPDSFEIIVPSHDPELQNFYSLTAVHNVVDKLFMFIDVEHVGNPRAAYTELWETDGTVSGTKRIRTFENGLNLRDVYGNTRIEYLASETLLFFWSGNTFWVSDGTDEGTVELFEYEYDQEDRFSPFIAGAMVDEIYFVVSNEEKAFLWKSDGTVVNTQLVAQINENRTIYEYKFATYNNKLYFMGNEGIFGQELWVSDGTPAGTGMLLNINDDTNNANPQLIGQIGNDFIFTVERRDELGRVANHALYRLNGETGETTAVSELDGVIYYRGVSINNHLLFSIDHTDGNTQLWRTDGTSAGTKLVKNVNSTSLLRSNDEQFLGVVNGVGLFAGNDGSGDVELWRTDGTTGGTMQLKELNLEGSSDPRNFISFGNRLYFSATDAFGDESLYQSDGTADGTILFKNLATESNRGSVDYAAANENGLYFFQAVEGAFLTRKLWRSDGTMEGTVELYDSGETAVLRLLGTSDDLLYFVEYLFAEGEYNLWVTDGTEGGAVFLTTLRNVLTDVTPVYLNGLLFFTAADEDDNWEVWQTDGTEGGTFMVREIVPSDGFGRPSGYQAFDNKVFFSMISDQLFGGAVEPWMGLWSTDGTGIGTMNAVDLPLTIPRLRPQFWGSTNGYLYFTAESVQHGNELWRIKATNPTVSVLDSDNGDVLVNGVACEGQCEQIVALGDTVTLTAVPDPDYRFARWEGACVAETTDTCTLTVTENLSVTAVFEPDRYELFVPFVKR